MLKFGVYLNLYFPLTKEELIQKAMKHGANHTIMEDLKSIPEKDIHALTISSRLFNFRLAE